MAFLRDPLWQFVIYVAIALLIGIASIITSIVVFRKQQVRKAVSYEIISDTSVLSINKMVKEEIELHYKGKLVGNLRLVILKIENSGDAPIVASDYIEPITFQLEG